MSRRSNNPAMNPTLPQDDQAQDPWDPNTISNIVFGAIMVFIGIIAIWQGHRKSRSRTLILDEEEILFIGPRLLDSVRSQPSQIRHANQPVPDPSLAPSQISRAIEHNQVQELNLGVISNGNNLEQTPSRVVTMSTIGDNERDVSAAQISSERSHDSIDSD